VDWLPGFENSAPVRIGNAAHQQFQIDVYGEVIDTLHLARRAELNHQEHEWRVERELLEHLEKVWRQPDQGIWEVRGPQQDFTHSKLMAWVAFDRAVKDIEEFKFDGPVKRWRKLRDKIHAEICDKGFNTELNAFVQTYDGDQLDASLLMMTEVGFLPAADARIQGTVAAIEKHLTRDDLVERYSQRNDADGLPPGEGKFLLCTFWLADNYALLGRMADARRVFQKLLDIRNDVGLLAEQYDPVAGRQLGNFPQAFSHVGLINTAHNLTDAAASAKIRSHG
jgi:GH15 family glucan-1,4-alpha-glucosidase